MASAPLPRRHGTTIVAALLLALQLETYRFGWR
jgi:hypothetical protein